MDVFGAIADPIRRELLLRLADGPARVVDLAGEHAVSRPAISKHLRVLSDAGLVRGPTRVASGATCSIPRPSPRCARSWVR
nr:hypothetical protein GCM10025730_02280 [Promicromonospora thailandica]